ncbi:F-box/kelch-repeat protein [Camellia lanceoleosa]|uniref:F-box/kelch-repeat protein n=1 Tax=Camellia lanceoleosa TaxID=1840588 RepID=A0ACC0GNS7_9ERIC|nr:F-box/kelch-repeat protein [Camellia lanceoleosa]
MNDEETIVELDCPFQVDGNVVFILGSCNGFTRACGFGYDKSTNDYKAVRIFSEWGRGGGLFIEEEFVEEDRRLSLWYSSASIYFRIICKSGSPHVDTDSSYSSWVIVSLDLEKETYEAIVPRDYGDGVIDLTLCVLKGCLHVLCNFPTCANVWVMSKNDEREPWTKLFTIPYSVVLNLPLQIIVHFEEW